MAMSLALVGLAVPVLTIKMLKRRRLSRLEDQLVDGIQTLSSGVRAGLNLVQAMELVNEGQVDLKDAQKLFLDFQAEDHK